MRRREERAKEVTSWRIKEVYGQGRRDLLTQVGICAAPGTGMTGLTEGCSCDEGVRRSQLPKMGAQSSAESGRSPIERIFHSATACVSAQDKEGGGSDRQEERK